MDSLHTRVAGDLNYSLWSLFILTSLVASALPLLRLYRTDIRTAMEGV